ncbi:dolichyl-phosphate-mannose--protein mannosyltransferase [Bifidobacterium vespertilionis]|uniref:dolichyl-phosphate-mannose--protein mannosyltransferase n=1 Tax=Bifidobacterium vespertilionis TaxID=2562524 RepID=UPI001BDC4A4D|nr:phospholipid carrier-dependent glycosyltransferase [Bifidobacterium vespertilionis]MBT1179596.1 phospholipid carrier-dependent glycosyltransferase [Bifidobacterium vespertilionis]
MKLGRVNSWKTTATAAQVRALGWILPLLMAAFGGLLRFVRLGSPHAIVFDETYYVKDAYTMLMTGEPRNWPKDVGTAVSGENQTNALFAAGDTDRWYSTAEYVVHPPVGKWLIAAGLKLFGGADSSFAWRASTAIAGTVAILILCRVALRLFRNLPIAVMAGFLMSVDGLGITMSRTGLLDNFIMVLTLGALSLLLIHRDWARARLHDAFERDSRRRGVRWLPGSGLGRAGGLDGRGSHEWVLDATGPFIALSPWRVGAAILLGLATGVKWSGTYFFAVFCVISVIWDAWERRQAGYRSWLATGLWKDALPAALYMVPIYVLTYLAGWIGWFIHPDSYMHNWAVNHPGEGVTWLPDSWRSFVEYHRQMWQFHTTLTTHHDYMANPLTWPLQVRPTSFYWEDHLTGNPGLCALNPGGRCVAAITSIGNPFLWWAGSLCVVIAIIVAAFVRRGDWRIWAVLAGLLAGWLPWAQYLNRTTFTFYSIVILPAMILAICYVADWLRGMISARAYHVTCGVVLGVIGLAAVFWYPIWTAIPVPYEFWLSHMWFDSWI